MLGAIAPRKHYTIYRGFYFAKILYLAFLFLVRQPLRKNIASRLHMSWFRFVY